jgi:FkbM family methyltransferase
MGVRAVCRELLGRFPLADGLFRRFVWSRIHFAEIEMRFLDSLGRDSIDIAFDVGAAAGSYAWILNRKSKQVFSFEPGDRHARYLQRVVFGTRISVVRAAVGIDCRRVTMYTPGSDANALHSATLSVSNPVSSHSGTKTSEVDQISLDSFLAQEIDPSRSVDVLKIDVEGYELEVLKGARALIVRHHPLIICEIEQRHNAGYAEIFALLRAAGYRSYVFQESDFRAFDGEAIEGFQSENALKARLDGSYDRAKNLYINNFIFQHPESRIRVVK